MSWIGPAAAPVLNAPGYTEAYRQSRRSLVTHDRRKVLFVVNDAGFFKSHRLCLAQEALRRGFEPVVVCGESTGEDALEEFGIRCRVFDLSRSGLNPLRDVKTFLALLRIYRDEAPDIVHHVTIKPVIYGTLASRFAHVPAVVNAIPGMGFVFTQRGFTARVVRGLVNLLYRIALSHDNMRFIFQNREDLQNFVENTVIPEQLTYLIRGSGVDLNEFPFARRTAGTGHVRAGGADAERQGYSRIRRGGAQRATVAADLALSAGRRSRPRQSVVADRRRN